MAGNKLPIIGPWKKKITRIERMAMIDCVPDGFALVQGIAVAFFHVFWTVAGPECIDSAWDRVKVGKRPHRGFMARGFSIGPTIHGGSGKRAITMFALGSLAQKIGFGLALVDGVLNGVYYGSSLVRRYSGCFNPTAPGAQLTMENAVPILLPPAEFIVTTWTVAYVNGMSAGPAGVALTVGVDGFYTAFLSIEQEKNAFPGLGDCDYVARLWDMTENKPLPDGWMPVPGMGESNKVQYVQDIWLGAGQHNIQCIIQKTVGVLFIKKANFTVTGGKYHAPFAAYDCGAKINVVT